MTWILPAVHVLLALLLAPFLLSLINRTKAFFAGRNGQPWLQPYHDLWKLLRKGAVYSRTTTWVFRAAPLINLAAILAALTLVPFGDAPGLWSFPGDFLVLVGLLGLARLAMVLAALDTGSAFEGMGASREVLIAAVAEPALILSLAALARETGKLSLGLIHLAVGPSLWGTAGVVLALVALALIVVLLAEASRIPVDDPTTHLELTMIHEVMVLDHGGPDLAFILYAQALKLWLLGSLLLCLVFPLAGVGALATLVSLLALLALAGVIGIVESIMARLQMQRVPQLLVGALALAAVAFILQRPGGQP
jgi:formate hydrogenlyase subunit 4